MVNKIMDAYWTHLSTEPTPVSVVGFVERDLGNGHSYTLAICLCGEELVELPLEMLKVVQDD